MAEKDSSEDAFLCSVNAYTGSLSLTESNISRK